MFMFISKVMGLVRKGDWNGAGEQLKEVNLSPLHISHSSFIKIIFYIRSL